MNNKAASALKAVDSKNTSPELHSRLEISKMPHEKCLVCETLTAGYGKYREGVVCSAACGTQYETERNAEMMTRKS